MTNSLAEIQNADAQWIEKLFMDFCIKIQINLQNVRCVDFEFKRKKVSATLNFISSHSKSCTRRLKCFVLEHNAINVFKTKHLRCLVQALVQGFESLEILGLNLKVGRYKLLNLAGQKKGFIFTP